MEIHVRELFAGKWMEDKTVDVEDSLENGRSVGIVRVDLHSNLADLRREIDLQISRDSDVPKKFAFVEKLGKQLVEIWNEEEPVLRVKDLVGREPEILIVERGSDNNNPTDRQPNRKPRNTRRKSNRRNVNGPREPDDTESNSPVNGGNRRRRQTVSDRNPKQEEENLYSGSADERYIRRNRGASKTRNTRLKSQTRNQYKLPPLQQRQRPFLRRQQSVDPPRNHRDRDVNNGFMEEGFRQVHVERRSASHGRKARERAREWVESDPDSTSRNSRSPKEYDLGQQIKDEIERKRPATVRIRKEKSLTSEELRFQGDHRPSIKNSIMKKSVSIDDLRDMARSDSDPDGFATADSTAMDDYFLDRQPFSFSALNLRDLESRKTRGKNMLEPSKMERRISGLLNRIRETQGKVTLLKNIGEEHWRGRFYQLRRVTAPLEDRVRQLEDEEDDLQDNLIRLFELRKPVRYKGMYGGASKKNSYILEAQTIQNDVNQLNTQLENIDLDLLKYRKMRDIVQNQNGSLSRDINREKFLRHLLLNRSLQTV